MENIRIAVLLTCHNRKNLTVSCLKSVLKARDVYKESHRHEISLNFFITDDNSSDGTSEAVTTILKNEALTIIKADGNAFWAGGMRLAWKKAVTDNTWDFFLLLNDDTEVWTNLFDELLEADAYSKKIYGKSGIYSGHTSEFKNPSRITFGGKALSSSFIKRFERVYPNGKPQNCHIVNANILLVSNEVYQKIGMFPEYYIHGAADNDYGMRSLKNGFPVLVTSNVCGSCDDENYDFSKEAEIIKKMSIKERKKYFANPVHSIHDKLEFSKRWRKWICPIILVSHFMRIYFPSIYYYINISLKYT